MPLKSNYNHIVFIMEGKQKKIRFVLKIHHFVLRLSNISFCGLYTPENTNKQVDFGVAIADRVYDLLKERNMTQRDFAKALNKTETEVSRWLSGTHNLTLSSIAKMATVLGDDIITTTHTLRPYKIPDVEQYATSVAEEINT